MTRDDTTASSASQHEDGNPPGSNHARLALFRRVPSKALIALAGVVCFALAAVAADYWRPGPSSTGAVFVGRASCIDCHADQADKFAGSHHDLAMDVATDATVLGDFNDAELAHDGITSRMFRDGDRFMVRTDGPSGELEDFQVKYVFGVDPLQQYMVEFDRTPDMPPSQIARLQVLRICWDTHKKRWFYLRPPDVDDRLLPDDPLHWTGVAQRWQTMCADCHSTNLKRNYDVTTNQYHTTFSEIDVSCEACHGPGSVHVELAQRKSLFWDRQAGYALANLKSDDPTAELESCAPCHSRRGVMDAAFAAGDSFCDHYNLELLGPDTYHADGQIKDEVYVYGSFIQSKMYHKGIRCTDCHDPHSLKLKHEGNATCTSCHQHAAGKYDVPSHHHHQPGTAGAMCVNCHMPHTTYMAVDARRDHSLRVPRPDLSVKLGTPNACSSCHVRDRIESIDADRRSALTEYADWLRIAESGDTAVADAVDATDQWCDEACEKWYGEQRQQPPHFAEPLVGIRRGTDGAIADALKIASQPSETTPAIARATVLSEMAQRQIAAAIPVAIGLLQNDAEHPIVRAAAISVAAGDAPRRATQALLPLLEAPSRLVRDEAARRLAGGPLYAVLNVRERSRVDLALREVKAGLMVASDRAGAHMGWAMLCEQRGANRQAVEAYETAIRVEPNMTGPRTNLAALLERIAGRGRPPESAGMIRRAAELRSQELPLLERDAKLAPDVAAVQYRYGLALYLAGDSEAALKTLRRAVELEPDVEDFQLAVRLLSEKINSQKPMAAPQEAPP